ncbi:putative Disease resistance protein RPS2 [Corchorus capsularis]|uniref:Putative Disease resistance protein RPS2 n=1 Tax=Corchorus capsularis TaxID=210143 RepID=A0A1R3IJ58_COCAP|nr:putative Disease resistance protein RPS2 [Corchorus capsularis]
MRPWRINLYWRYHLSKQATKKSLSISELMENSKFEVIGHLADLLGITLLPSKAFMSSKSADFVERQIMEALKDDGVNIIIVWRMKLGTLKIESMNCFKGLCNGPPPDGFLKKLVILEITKCGSLKSVFPPSVAKNLVQLKSVEIADCDILEQVFEEMEGANDEVLQKLETLEIRGCGSLESLSPMPVDKKLIQLKILDIDGCNMLEKIIEEIEVRDSEILSTNTQVQRPYLLPKSENSYYRSLCQIGMPRRHKEAAFASHCINV